MNDTSSAPRHLQCLPRYMLAWTVCKRQSAVTSPVRLWCPRGWQIWLRKWGTPHAHKVSNKDFNHHMQPGHLQSLLTLILQVSATLQDKPSSWRYIFSCFDDGSCIEHRQTHINGLGWWFFASQPKRYPAILKKQQPKNQNPIQPTNFENFSREKPKSKMLTRL